MANPQERALTTAQIGGLVGYSTQQVRDLEGLGILPRAERGPNGYRRFGHRHVVALRAYRALALAIGPVPARRLVPMLLASSIDLAAEQIDDLHSVIARDRARVREARRCLDAVLEDTVEVFDECDAMTIGELREALGVSASALRHWEVEDLIRPERVAPSQTRRYNARSVAEARIVAALRAGGYPIPSIARILARLRTDGITADARTALDTRLADLSRRSIALLAGASHLHALLSTWGDTTTRAHPRGGLPVFCPSPGQ